MSLPHSKSSVTSETPGRETERTVRSPLQHAHRLFDGAADEGLDLLGRGVGEVGLDGDGGMAHVGEELDRQPLVAHHTEHDDGERGHDHAHPAPDGQSA